MNTRFAFLFVVVAAAFLSRPAFAEPAGQRERIAASFLLALGRPPSADEIGEWAKQEPVSVVDLIARHREQLHGDAAARRAAALRAAADALGRAPTEQEIVAASSAGATYTELMQRHVQRLRGQPSEYEQVIRGAYLLLVRRDAYPEEIEYWKQRETHSYALLVGCLDDWARRNQPGLMVTTGTPTVSVNCAFLNTVRLSPAIATEARAAAGLEPSGDAALASAAGHNLVAAGADGIVTGGRIHFVAAGRPEIVPAPAGR
ncbi:MAG TPA: hypothetical protein VGD81_00915 [Opitutaceae bacterium]